MRSHPLPLPPLTLRKKNPRLILGLSLSGMAAEVDAQFRTMGWDVLRFSPEEAARLAHRQKASAIVLSLEGAQESGLLMCAKIRLVHPHARIVLIGPESQRNSRFARLAGAAGYLPDRVTAPAVARAVLGN